MHRSRYRPCGAPGSPGAWLAAGGTECKAGEIVSLIEKAAGGRSRAAGGACPAWCVFDHDRAGRPAIVLHESLPAVIEVSGSGEADVAEWIDVRTTQYSPEEAGELPGPPAVELSCHRGGRYRVTTLTAGEARRLAAGLLTAAAHAEGDPYPHLHVAGS
jgi:uncharacterized protein DUF6907